MFTFSRVPNWTVPSFIRGKMVILPLYRQCNLIDTKAPELPFHYDPFCCCSKKNCNSIDNKAPQLPFHHDPFCCCNKTNCFCKYTCKAWVRIAYISAAKMSSENCFYNFRLTNFFIDLRWLAWLIQNWLLGTIFLWLDLDNAPLFVRNQVIT